jgi:hypothetical protein
MPPPRTDTATTSRATAVRGWLWYAAFLVFVLWLGLLLLQRY